MIHDDKSAWYETWEIERTGEVEDEETAHSWVPGPGTEVAGGVFELSDCWLRYNSNEVNKKGVIETN